MISAGQRERHVSAASAAWCGSPVISNVSDWPACKRRAAADDHGWP